MHLYDEPVFPGSITASESAKTMRKNHICPTFSRAVPRPPPEYPTGKISNPTDRAGSRSTPEKDKADDRPAELWKAKEELFST